MIFSSLTLKNDYKRLVNESGKNYFLKLYYESIKHTRAKQYCSKH